MDSPFISGRPALADAADLIDRYGDDAGLEAAVRAEESREALEQRLADMQNELETEISRLRGELDPQTVAIERSEVKPRKTDITVEPVALLWLKAGGA